MENIQDREDRPQERRRKPDLFLIQKRLEPVRNLAARLMRARRKNIKKEKGKKVERKKRKTGNLPSGFV